MNRYDIAVIGGGPGGATLSSFLVKKGFSVVLFDKEVFPRFRIGESLLPCSMDIFKEIGFFEKLNSGKYIQKFGARFIDHRTNEEILFNFGDNNIPSQSMAFEVERAKFDHDLLNHAASLGVVVKNPERVEDFTESTDGITVTTDQDTYHARYLADCSGRIAMIGNKLKMRQPNKDLINNIGVFSHFKGVKRAEGKRAGDIVIGVLPNNAWSWTIPFQGAHTSVGVVTNTKQIPSGVTFEKFLDESIRTSPVFQDSMQNAERVAEVQAISNYSHTCESMFGNRWIQVGDAAAFLDPIFSSGVHVSVSTAKFASDAIEKAFDKNLPFTEGNLGISYQQLVRKGVRRFHYLIRLFYDTDFVKDMKKILTLRHSRDAFTSAVAGDVWNDENVIFKMQNL